MMVLTWNAQGIRQSDTVNHFLMRARKTYRPDIVCLMETKANCGTCNQAVQKAWIFELYGCSMRGDERAKLCASAHREETKARGFNPKP